MTVARAETIRMPRRLPVATETTRDDVLALEKRFWDAMRSKDAKRAQQMTDDSCIVVGAQGVSSIDGPTMAKLTKEGPWELEQYSFDEPSAQVRFVGPDVAIVAYSVGERVTVDGETLEFDVNDASVWVRRDGAWRCALHTESLSGDPYGRDRLRA
jgi:ketosteroid isomerase-like protein